MSKRAALKLTRRRFLGLTASAVAGTAWWQWNEVDRLVVERRELHLPRWNADGFKVAILADFHANTRPEGERAERAMRMAIGEKPDAILLVGDYVHKEWPETLPSLETALAPARESASPVFAAMGNHDYWVSTTAKIIEALKRNGILLLRNEIADLDGVAIWGIDDGIENRDRHDALDGRRDSGSVLAMFHEPDCVARVDRRIGLMAAGHSHGGQICLPFGFPLHTPFGARRYKSGFYADAKVPLYVTRGIGTVGPRKRSFCPPEVSLLTLFGGAGR